MRSCAVAPTFLTTQQYLTMSGLWSWPYLRGSTATAKYSVTINGQSRQGTLASLVLAIHKLYSECGSPDAICATKLAESLPDNISPLLFQATLDVANLIIMLLRSPLACPILLQAIRDIGNETVLVQRQLGVI